MADPDFSEIALGGNWLGATEVYQKLAATFGREALDDLRAAFKSGAVRFACRPSGLTPGERGHRMGLNFRAIETNSPSPRYDPVSDWPWREADFDFRREYGLRFLGGKITAEAEGKPFAWSVLVWADGARRCWPIVFPSEVAPADRPTTLTGAIRRVLEGNPKLLDEKPSERDAIIKLRIGELGFASNSDPALTRIVQGEIRKLRAQKNQK